MTDTLVVKFAHKTYEIECEWVGECIMGDVAEELYFSGPYEADFAISFPVLEVRNNKGFASPAIFCEETGEIYSQVPNPE